MQIPPNLISDSALIQDTFNLLNAGSGRASFTEIANSVFFMANADEDLAARLVADLVGSDSRFVREETHLALNRGRHVTHPLRETEFVVLDVEAISGKSMPDRIIELGAYRLRGAEIVAEYQTLIDPELPLPRFIVSLTGINEKMLKGAPVFADIVHSWLEFAGDAVLVAHNANFDLPLLNREIARSFPGHRMRNEELCTVDLTRRLMPELQSRNLDALAYHFGLEISERHRAASDALATARLFLRLLDRLEARGLNTLEQARQFRSRR